MFGGALALGAATFVVLAGVVIGLGGEALFAGVTFTSTAGITIRWVVGVGPHPARPRPARTAAVLDARRRERRGPDPASLGEVRRDPPVTGFALFGFSYVLAGFG